MSSDDRVEYCLDDLVVAQHAAYVVAVATAKYADGSAMFPEVTSSPAVHAFVVNFISYVVPEFTATESDGSR